MTAKQITRWPVNAADPGAKNQRKDNWCVVYRTGTREKFEWHRVGPMSRASAEIRQDTLTHGAKPTLAYLVNYDRSVSIGLPSTFEHERCGHKAR